MSCRINAIMPGVTDIVSAVILPWARRTRSARLLPPWWRKASQRSSLSMGPTALKEASKIGFPMNLGDQLKRDPKRRPW